jgi:hypothetical protein
LKFIAALLLLGAVFAVADYVDRTDPSLSERSAADGGMP